MTVESIIKMTIKAGHTGVCLESQCSLANTVRPFREGRKMASPRQPGLCCETSKEERPEGGTEGKKEKGQRERRDEECRSSLSQPLSDVQSPVWLRYRQ